jgi:hypothetical protein
MILIAAAQQLTNILTIFIYFVGHLDDDCASLSESHLWFRRFVQVSEKIY